MRDTRAQLLLAVGAVLHEVGLADLSLRKVAARAGVSHAAPGVLFGDRAGMYTAFAIEGFGRLERRLAAAPAGADGPDDVAAIGRAYIAFAFDEPEVFEVMFRRDLLRAEDPAYLRAARQAYRPFLEVMRRCVAQGVVRADDARDVQLMAWSTVHGFAALWRSRHAAGRHHDKAARRLTERLAASIRGSAGRPS
jgi:AcrR family transcriptional regulator